MKWNPEDYAKNSEAQLKWAHDLRRSVNLQGDESVLDVGCGDGKITALFSESLPAGRVVGVDSSPDMIDYASHAFSSTQYPNLSFHCIDARTLPFEAEFDLCFSNATLHWVDDHLAVLKGVSRALRSGGRLVISCGGQGNGADVVHAFNQLIANEPWQPFFEGFTFPFAFHGTDVYQPWLDEAGFTVERLELVPKDMTHQGAEGLAGWLRTTWMPFTHRVPEERRDDFIANLVETYLARIPLDPEGFSHVRMVRLEVNATKP